MGTSGAIQNSIEQLPDEQLRRVCLGIFNQVLERRRRSNQGLWTLNVIAAWVGLSATDPWLVRGVQLLTTRPDLRLLEMHFILFDPEDPSGLGEPVEDEEVAAAFASGFLVHPSTGERISGFEEVLLPYFVPAPQALAQ